MRCVHLLYAFARPGAVFRVVADALLLRCERTGLQTRPRSDQDQPDSTEGDGAFQFRGFRLISSFSILADADDFLWGLYAQVEENKSTTDRVFTDRSSHLQLAIVRYVSPPPALSFVTLMLDLLRSSTRSCSSSFASSSSHRASLTPLALNSVMEVISQIGQRFKVEPSEIKKVCCRRFPPPASQVLTLDFLLHSPSRPSSTVNTCDEQRTRRTCTNTLPELLVEGFRHGRGEKAEERSSISVRYLSILSILSFRRCCARTRSVVTSE
jgi:hypothetical protein